MVDRQNQSFTCMPWETGTNMWPSLFAVPRFEFGRLSSFGQDAVTLLNSFFTSRVQVSLRPDANTRVTACYQTDFAQTNTLEEAYNQGAVEARHEQGRLSANIALFTGEPGSLRITTDVVPAPGKLPGVRAFAKLDVDLQDTVNAQVPMVGLGIVRSGFQCIAWSSVMRQSPYGKLQGRLAFRLFDELLVGVETSLSNRDETRGRKVTIDKLDFRASYSGNSTDSSGRQHYYQATLSVEDLATSIHASYYEHVLVRESNPSFWRNIAYGGEFAQSASQTGGRPAYDVRVGSLYQFSKNFLVKARASTKGVVDALAAVRFSNVFDWMPDFEIAACVSKSIWDKEIKYGISFSMSDEATAAETGMASTFRIPKLNTRF
eukprot:m.76720 g.76720  ORF g.76720 m.76720 type:complete len:376 (-) comp14655_c0_seq1:132-1259(-)